MTIEDIKKRIENIELLVGDDEAAHSEEDGLRDDFIRWIAETETGELGEKAKLILSTNDIYFHRWCA
jgi:hypothetical protein